MKRIAIIWLLILSLILSLTGCKTEDSSEVAVTVGSASVYSDVFAYYLDEVLQNKDDSYTMETAIADAEALCKHYVIINTAFEEQGISLPSLVKASIVSEIDNTWNIYGNYYKKIGVSKETMTKVKYSEAYEEELITSIFGTGGEKEISEEDQKNYYAENYICFKVIFVYLTGDETTDSSVKTTFEEMQKSINDDNSFESIYASYAEKVELDPNADITTNIINSTSTDYPEQFFTDVKALDVGAVSVLTYDSYIFLVQRVDGSTYFSNYQRSILAAMATDSFESSISDSYGDITVSGSSSTEKSCYKTIISTKNK